MLLNFFPSQVDQSDCQILPDPILGSYRIRQSDRIPIGFLVTELYRNPSGRIPSDCLSDPIVRSDAPKRVFSSIAKMTARKIWNI